MNNFPVLDGRCRNATVLGFLLVSLLWPAVAVAQVPTRPSTLASTISSGQLKFRISSGRIQVVALRSTSRSSSMSGISRREKTVLRVANGVPNLTHESSNTKEEITLQITAGNQIAIHREGKGETSIVAVSFSHAPNTPARLKLGSGEKAKAYQGPTIWHLLITRRDECRDHLIPLLQLLRADWKLSESAAAIEAELLRMASGDELPDHRQFGVLVAQLGDDRFAKREEADRQLRASGDAVLSYLRRLDFEQLDAEQQFRVRRIIMSLSGDVSADTPAQAARTLVGDPTIWLALLSRDEESTRRIALRQLNSLLDRDVEFDPTAEESTRAKQIEEIRGLPLEGLQ